MAFQFFQSLSDWSAPVSLDAAGLVALADLSTIARRTLLTGTSDLLDCLVLCPGLHQQQNATKLHSGECPPMAAMATGYMCRVENPAMVSYLQQIGRTGQLTIVNVHKRSRFDRADTNLARRFLRAFISSPSVGGTAAYLSIVALTCCVIILFGAAREWWGLGVLATLMLARFCNVIVVRRRSTPYWHGASEPGVQCDNLVLLTEDRWIRLQGNLDDIKAVTSGQWLREPTFPERSATAFATLLVYLTAAIASNVDQAGKITILALLLISVGLLSVANELTETLSMHGRIVSVKEPRTKFDRRRSMISMLIREVGRSDWALRMGLVVAEDDSSASSSSVSSPIEGRTSAPRVREIAVRTKLEV